MQWESLLKQLNVVGTFSVDQGSDIVGDPDVAAGIVHKIRLSLPQAKAAFASSQKEGQADAGGVDAITCDFDEILEAIARPLDLLCRLPTGSIGPTADW